MAFTAECCVGMSVSFGDSVFRRMNDGTKQIVAPEMNWIKPMFFSSHSISLFFLANIERAKQFQEGSK